MKRLMAVCAAAALLAACKGDKGDRGPAGAPGQGGTSVGTITGTVTDATSSAPIAGAAVSTLPASGSTSTAANGSYQIVDVPIGVYSVQIAATGYGTQTVANVSVVAGGTATANAALAIPIGATGTVTGAVSRRGGGAVSNATVALVDANALAGSSSDTPLEALAAGSAYTGTTDAAGGYAITGVVPASYFVHVAPAAGDATVFPGGDASRASFAVAPGATVTKDVSVSQRAPGAATYVGSTACLGCHSAALTTVRSALNWKRSLHALVYRAPGVASANQDFSALTHDQALASFEPGNAADNTGAADDLGLRISKTDDPTTWNLFPAGYNLLLGHDATGYFFQTETPDKALVSDRYYAIFTFGGNGIYKERWVTRAKNDKTFQPCATAPCTDWSYYIAPLQFDENLQAGVQRWNPYSPGNWAAPASAGGPALVAAKTASFDLNCAGCHFTGTTLAVEAVTGNFQAGAVSTTGGAIDYDGDGDRDDVSIGCEACHGPGSAHAAAPALGANIVQPRFLSTERENQLCGNCHTRGAGKGGFTGQTGVHTEYPSKGTDALAFAYPGMGRAEFVADYHADALGTWPDDKRHSRQHHQQANDFLRSAHTRNPYDLVSCSDCHDVHDRLNGPSLWATVSDNKLCLDCHAPFGFGLPTAWTLGQEAVAVSTHMADLAYMAAGYNPLNPPTDTDALLTIATGGVGRCTTCHMPKTAASQSRFVHEQVGATLQPAGPRIRGDVSSHFFDIVWPATSETVFVNNATNNQLSNSCGSCHNTLVNVLPNYAY